MSTSTRSESDAYSLKLLVHTFEQLGRDWVSLAEAKIRVEARIAEASEAGWRFNEWAGTDAVLGSLMLAMEHIERRREYYGDLINKVQAGEIENTDDDVADEGLPVRGSGGCS
jgi:hypothetical protein